MPDYIRMAQDNVNSYVANAIIPPSVGSDASVLEAASAALGIYTTYAAASPSREALSRVEKWELQAVARRLLPAERLRVCCICVVPDAPGVKVLHSPSHGSGHYGSLMRCGSVWSCPVCSAKISEVRRGELEQAIGWWRGCDDGLVAMLTLTTSHGRSDDLGALLAALRGAFRTMTKSRRYRALFKRYGVAHTVRALEVTWGYDNGWHPHLHILLFIVPELNIDSMEDELFAMWFAAAGRFGLVIDRKHGVKLQATTGAIGDYVSKYGKGKWSAADELARANTKRGRGDRFAPFDLLRQVAFSGESQFADLFIEYARVFKGQRHLVFSDGLRAAAGLLDKTDDQIVDELHEDAVLLATLGEREWSAVRALGLRGQVLEVARAGDRSVLVEYIRGVVASAAALN